MLENILKSIDEPLGMRWKLAAIFFLIGLCIHSVVFFRAHNEGDELIYKALVEQLDNGRGYTLQGSPLLEKGLIDKTQYDHPLFFHPPGGIALYWVFYRIFGYCGFSLVQLFSYALFFWSMMFLAKSMNLTSSNIALALVASLSAFSPVMSHVTTKFWLDGSLLAFATLAVAIYVWAVANNKPGWVFIAGLVLGYASLIKITAFLVVPGVILMSWYLLRWASSAIQIRNLNILLRQGYGGQVEIRRVRRSSQNEEGNNKTEIPMFENFKNHILNLFRVSCFEFRISDTLKAKDCETKTLKPSNLKRYACLGLLFLAAALIVQLPWELWQWIKVGSPFPSWAGRPSLDLIESNRYVHYLTEIRSPWVYLKLTSVIVWTSVPTFFLLVLLWSNKALRWMRMSLVIWILTVLVFHMVLGFMGYSKVMRYAILMTPPFIILFSSLLDEAIYRFNNEENSPITWTLTVIISISLLAFAMEILTGIQVSLFSHKDIIFPLIGGAWMMR
jgi:hypothetical protein